MALTELHPLSEVVVTAHSPSVGASPIVAAAIAPVRGRVVKVGCVLAGTITTSDLLVSVSISGTTVAGGGFTVSRTSAIPGSMGSAVPTGANNVVEGDYILFTPSVAAGANIPAQFYAVIRRA